MWAYRHTDELYHHGVLGMKWGVRRTPEQLGHIRPKKEKSKSKHRLKLEQKYLSKGMSQSEAEKAAAKRIKVEKVIVAAAAITVVTAAYIARQRHIEQWTIDALTDAEERAIMDWSDMSVLTKQKTWESDAASVNPSFKKGKIFQINCANCTAAYELRRRGYDVKAQPSLEGRTTEEWTGLFKGLTLKPATLGESSDIYEQISKWGDGARGVVAVTFPRWMGNAAHVFSVEVIDGKAQFIDSQKPKRYADGFFKIASTINFGRVDNLDLSDGILDAVTKRGE